MKKLITFAFIACTIANPANAEYNVYDLLQKCKDVAQRESYVDAGICVGYLAGINDMRPVSGKTKKQYCLYQEVSQGQMVNIFVKWAENNPEQQHISAFLGFIEAMKKVFPCKE